MDECERQATKREEVATLQARVFVCHYTTPVAEEEEEKKQKTKNKKQKHVQSLLMLMIIIQSSAKAKRIRAVASILRTLYYRISDYSKSNIRLEMLIDRRGGAAGKTLLLSVIIKIIIISLK